VALLKEHHDELGEILSQDTGKTFEDAKGDVWRGIEVVEQAANIGANMMGETVENVATRTRSPAKSGRFALPMAR
jgi:malonate-semialdehyde dehydrogenase (acetylating)/methylmalonate-semialdehyde dehydrogenase